MADVASDAVIRIVQARGEISSEKMIRVGLRLLKFLKCWLRGVDSNHDSQIQSLESYQLDDPGVAARSLAEGISC